MFLSWFPENTYKRHRIISMKKKEHIKITLTILFTLEWLWICQEYFRYCSSLVTFSALICAVLQNAIQFSPVSSCSLLNISALHVQYGIQALAKFKRPECTRLHLRELQSQKFSRRSIRPKLPRKALRSQSWWVLLRPYYHCTLYL